MRYREIVSEVVVVKTAALRDQVEALRREERELAKIRPIMYGWGAFDFEIETEKLEAARLANQKQRLEVEKLRAEIAAGDDALEDALILARIEKTRAEAAAKLGEL
ncbi:hypothetical protein BV96_02282 [Sphingomonas paucimobilis]|nr:hypothetical protein BV96_02282 [Sphingomonas paucimobilis]